MKTPLNFGILAKSINVNPEIVKLDENDNRYLLLEAEPNFASLKSKIAHSQKHCSKSQLYIIHSRQGMRYL